MKKTHAKFALLGLFGVVLLAFFWSYLNKYLYRSRASGDIASITFSPRTGGAVVGEQKTSDLLVTAQGGKKISGVDITFIGQDNIKIVNIGVPVPVSTGDQTMFQQIVKNVADKNARIAYVSSKAAAELPTAVKIPVTFVGTGHVSGKILIDLPKTQIVGTAEGNVFSTPTADTLEFTFGDPGTTTPTPLPSGPSIGVKIDPDVTSRIGTVFNTNLLIENITINDIVNPPGKRISGFNTIIKFDPTLIEVTKVFEPTENSEDTSKFIKLRNDINNTTGEIHLTYISQVPEADLPARAKVLIQAKGKKNGSGTFQPTAVQVTGNIPENAYNPIIRSGNVTITDGTIISPTPAIAGNVHLNLKLRFQGIVKSPASGQTMMVNVKVAGGNQPTSSSLTSTTQFAADSAGVWSGRASFNLPSGQSNNDYRIYIKGPKHLQKKICDNVPSETASGTYRCSVGQISLHDGENNFDFSKIILLVGDIPEQGTTGQNGVVDAFDVSFVRNNLGSKDEKVLAVADLNLDGIVDSQDFSLILASLSIKYDEE